MPCRRPSKLRDIIQSTLKQTVSSAQAVDDTYYVVVDATNVVEAVNQEVAAANGSLQRISRLRGALNTYEIPPATHKALHSHLK